MPKCMYLRAYIIMINNSATMMHLILCFKYSLFIRNVKNTFLRIFMEIIKNLQTIINILFHIIYSDLSMQEHMAWVLDTHNSHYSQWLCASDSVFSLHSCFVLHKLFS